MLKKTFAAAITAAVLLSSGAAMAQAPVDANWAFTKEAVELFKNKNGYTEIKSFELENPATGQWKVEGVKKINGTQVAVETIYDHTGKLVSEKKDD